MTSVNEPNAEGGPGERLRAAREAAGLSVGEVAEELQLLQSFVRALEQNSYERIRGDTFVRGYLRNYARLLGLDPEEIIASYLQARAHSGSASRSGAVKRQRPPRGTSGAGRIGVVVVLFAASALYLFHSRTPSTANSVVADAVVTVETGAGAQVVPLTVPEHGSQTDTP